MSDVATPVVLPAKGLLSSVELGRLLGPDRLRELVKSGVLTSIRIGGSARYFAKKDVERALRRIERT